MPEETLRAYIKDHIQPQHAPGLVRLAFHDAGTFAPATNDGGASGSITNDLELHRQENDGLQKTSARILEMRKNLSDFSLPDIIAVAGAVAIEMCGGPKILVGLGRQESLTPAPINRLPDKDDDLKKVLDYFSRCGFNKQETVALMGSHTLGDAEDKPFTKDRLSFNNSYFSRLISGERDPVLRFFHADEALLEDPDYSAWIKKYANDQELFFDDYKQAYKKMTWLTPK